MSNAMKAQLQLMAKRAPVAAGNYVASGILGAQAGSSLTGFFAWIAVVVALLACKSTFFSLALFGVFVH